MAAPTSVRVESNSPDTATIRWTYGGSGQISVFRSTDGSSYAEVTTTVTRVAVGTTSYADSGLTAGTKYWYKLSDDAGSSFSSVVTVWTHPCLPPAGSRDTFTLPRFDGDEQQSDPLNDMAERIESVLGGRLLDPQQCVACPEDGQLILNCSGHCKDWIAVIDQDVNSIAMQFCDEGSGNIELVIPAGTTRIIRGWPGGFGFTGDEPAVSGGTDGRSINVSNGPGSKAKAAGSRPGIGGGVGTGGFGGSGCACVPNGQGSLTIKSCNANNSVNCTTTKKLQLKACGGKGPYTWSKTGTINLSVTTGESTNVTPPTNSGSGVAGDAYYKQVNACGVCSSGVCTNIGPPNTTRYNCADAIIACSLIIAACGGLGTAPATLANGCCTGGSTNICGSPGPLSDCPPVPGGTGVPESICDQRTAGMITDGCNPCGLNAQGATVTVTDSLGTQTTIVLKS